MLKIGDRVALICPSGSPDVERARTGMEILRSWGLRPEVGPVLRACLEERRPESELDFLAGPDELRLDELHRALQGDFEACWVVRGGYGIGRLLPGLRIPQRARPVIGFSDVTALHRALQLAGWTDLVHGANLQSLAGMTADAVEATRRWIMEGEQAPLSGRWLVPGRAEGRLWGGNLCVLASLCGTAQGPEPGGGVLFLEDVNEAPYRVDRLLSQLACAGWLEGLSGLALGAWSGCGRVEPVLEHWARRLGVPALADLPAGHIADNRPLGLGQRVRLDQSAMVWLSRST